MADRTFIVYDEIKDTLDEMTDEEIGKLFRGMVDYHVTGEEPDLKGGLKFAFIPIRQQMDRDDDKWNRTREAACWTWGRKPVPSRRGFSGEGIPHGMSNSSPEETYRFWIQPDFRFWRWKRSWTLCFCAK